MAKLLDYLPFLGRRRRPLVTVLRLHGVVGNLGPLRQGLTMERIAGQIERAFAPKGLQAVALSVNCPGGSPVQSALIARRIRDKALEKEVKVYAFTEDVAASGGYWLACAADEIYADESSIVGSIGVISAGFGFSEAIKKIGVERRLHTSGEKKSLLDPFREEDPQDVERLKRVQAEIHDSFKALVRERRGERLKAEEEELFSGEFWTGRRALEKGLVDGLGELRATLRERYGKKVRLKVVSPPKGLFRRTLGSESALPASGAAGLLPAIDGQALAGGFLSALEERALWSRFGL